MTAKTKIYTLVTGYPTSPANAERLGLRPSIRTMRLLVAATDKIAAIDLLRAHALPIELRELRLASGNDVDALTAADVFTTHPVLFVQRFNPGPVVALKAAPGLTGGVIGYTSLVEYGNASYGERFTPHP